MKENAGFFTSSVLAKIIRSCLWMGILGFFVQNCAAMDDDKRPNGHFFLITYEMMGAEAHPLPESMDDEKKTKQKEVQEVQYEWLKEQLATLKEQVLQHHEQLATLREEVGNLRKSREADGRIEEQKSLVKPNLPIPLVAQGNEATYERFLKGALIYRPNGNENDDGMVTLPIRELKEPLEGTFNLFCCGDTGKYLSISTGYRKGKKPKNASKVEIWFAPRFLIEKELNGTASHFKPIMNNWKQEATVGIFWTWGSWPADDGDMDYLTTENTDNLSKINLYENWKKAKLDAHILCHMTGCGSLFTYTSFAVSRFACKLSSTDSQ